MKTLANCTIKEFLQQINKIKKKAAAFYDVVGIGDIRRTHCLFLRAMKRPNSAKR